MKSIYVDSQGNEWENGGTYTDASLVKMTDGTTTQKAITDLQARDINTFGTSDKWNGGSYSKGAYTIYNDTLYECIVAHSNVVPTNTTYWKKVSLSGTNSDLTTINKCVSKSNVTLLSIIQEITDNYIHRYVCSNVSGLPSTDDYNLIVMPFGEAGYRIAIAVKRAYTSEAYYCMTNYNSSTAWSWHTI